MGGLGGRRRPCRGDERVMNYQIVIGLEVHVQLATESKMFSSCGTDFGLPPNTQTDPVALGMPGTLPVMNRKAFELALKTAVALGAEIAPFTKWDRKNYYYPDLPKNYQISQYDLPFSVGGALAIPAAKDGTGGGACRLTRVHLEEDTGKLTHGSGGFSEVDLNRAGIPLLEIVSEPDIRSPADARALLEELRLTLRYLGVSDCEMQEGSLRCDANVNLHIDRDGATVATPIVEIKNLNSFRSVERALNYEAERQYNKWLADGLTIADAHKETRGWSDPEGVTKPQRQKETAADYRYFPEPDLVPVVVDRDWIDRVRATIGELPAARRARFESDYGLSAYDANVLVEQGEDVADYFDAVARATGSYKLASNWIQADILRVAKERKVTLDRFPRRARGARRPDRPGRAVGAEHEPGARSPRQADRGGRVDRRDHRRGGLPDGLRPRRDRRRRGRRARRQPQGRRRPQGRQEEARRREGIPPRPGHEGDRRQGRPRARRLRPRREARRARRAVLIAGHDSRTPKGVPVGPIDRREFLKGAGAALAGTGLVGSAGAAEPSAIRWKKAFMLGGVAKGPVLDHFRKLKAAGFAGVELVSPNELDRAEVLKARDETGLTIHGVSGSRHWKDALSDPDPAVVARGIAAIRQEFDDCKAYGGTTVLVVPAVVSKKVSYRDAYARSQAAIRSLIPDAERAGVKIAIEEVWNKFLLSPVEFARYIDEFNSPTVGAYFDVGNVVEFGYPQEWIRELGKRILKIHVKEYAKEKRFSYLLGDGEIDWPEVARALVEVGYDGWITAEVPYGDLDALTDVTRRMDKVLATS